MKQQSPQQTTTPQQPPGPAGLPIIGNLLEARRNPLQFLLRLSREFGDISRYQMGFYKGYVLNHPDYIQQVLQTNHQNYSKQNYTFQMLKPVIGEGLLTSDGEHWSHERRLIQPAFHHKEIIQLSTKIKTATNDMLKKWDAIALQGNTINLAMEMQELTLRIIGETLFSLDIGKDTDRIGRAFTRLNQDISYRLRTVFVPPLWIPTLRNLAFRRARAELDDIVYGIISSRHQQQNTSADLLNMLLKAGDEDNEQPLTDQQLRDEVMTLMLAGHETTATALTWTCYLLAQHPTVAERLRTELHDVLGDRMPTVDDLHELTYTKQVIYESLRLYPPVWILSRTAIGDDQIGDFHIPAGTILIMSQYAIHRHPSLWHEPEQFDPDRFTRQHSEKRHRYAYFPFGGGPRTCIGDHLAMMEIQLVLAMVAQRFRLELQSSHPIEPDPLITLRPRQEINILLRQHRD